MNRNTGHSSGGYPLAALFILMAVCAVLVTMLRPLARAVPDGRIGGKQLIVAGVVGALLTTAVGMAVGLFHYRQPRGVAIGAMTGLLMGAVIGPATLASGESLGAVLAASMGGCVLLVALGVVVRLRSRDRISRSFSRETDS